ncbi:hypothetical protein AN958_07306 [Leucoagaricus sp. SymC.cos]|nr:hypothetical protein AN958_07306 [Leucoagaricus sp. SymC.cos]
MATQVPTQRYTRSQEAGRGRGGTRGRGGRKGGNARRGGGTAPGRGSDATKDKPEEKPEKVEEDNKHEDEQQSAPAAGEEAGGDDEEVCWICAEPVKYWSVSECNHRTCHVCALRLRALYKKTDCTFCKEPQPTVIFTTSPDAEFGVYKPDDIPHKDAKLSIYFETQEMMEETLILLKFNCPDASCDYIGNGWADLKLHTRAVHARLMCDLCIRHKKVFSHEHALHMREKHEECFICKRNGIQYQYKGEQRRQFPDLVPQAVGNGYAGITSGRVLNAKNSTASRSSRPSRQVWDRVAAAASSSSTSAPQPRQYVSTQSQSQPTSSFPPLPGATSSSSNSSGQAPIPAFRQPTRTTAWSASASAAASPRAIEPRSVPASRTSKNNKQTKPLKLDSSLFPELPSSSAVRERPKIGGNVSLKNILGSSSPVVSAWQSGGGTGSGDGMVDSAVDGASGAGNGEGEESGAAKKGKKGKGKQKQMLFTLGSFPT